MATWLVTGGAGFIGSHLCDALLRRGDAVRVLDDLSTGKRENLPAGAELMIGDIADPAAVERALAGVDGCFHLAAIASVARGIDDWLGTHCTNLTGTITVFDAVRRHPVPVIYASSAAVYGDCPAQPLTERAPTAPLSAYGADKLGCELHARVARQVHGITTVGLRFFNVYGPRQDPDSPYSGVISI
ncbi:MAG: NAD-dependent epimerase/dehydratase family protein, partial [Acetobacteraceae bacterium]